MKHLTRLCLITLGLLHALPGLSSEALLTIDQIFDEAGRKPFSLPSHDWVGEQVVLYDRRPAKSERSLALFDPKTGKTRTLLEGATLLARLNDAIEPDEPLEEPGWPSAIDGDNLRAAYARSGDIVLVDLETGVVTPVATTDTKEKAPKFSPDGQWLAFLRGSDLYAWHIEKGEEIRLTSDGSDTRRNGLLPWVYWEELMGRKQRGFAWSPDSSAIAYLQSDSRAVFEAAFVDFKPIETPRLRRQRYPRAGTENPKVRVGVVTLANAKTQWIDLGAYPYEYLPRFQWLPNSQALAVQTLNRDQNALDVFVASTASGTVRHLLRETSDSWINVHDDLHFLDDSQGFIWRSARGGTDQLYRYGPDGELIAQITEGPALRASGASGGRDSALAFVDEDAGIVYYTGLGEASTERHLYRVNVDGSNQEQISDLPGLHAIRFSPDGGHYIDAHSSVDRLPALHVRSTKSNTAKLATTIGAEMVQALDLQTWQMLSLPAEDGTALPAMLLKPQDFDPSKRYPVLIYVYGGPAAPIVVNRWSGGTRGLYHQLLAQKGVVIMRVDNRSSAARSHAETAQILGQAYGPVEQGDLLDAVTWLQNQAWADASKIGIWGWSGGGTTTLAAMTGSDAFTAGVAVAPLTDLRYYDTVYAERYMKRPQDNPEGYERVSVVNKADQLKGRLLLVHGTYDDNVHPQSTWAFSDALIEANIQFDSQIYPMRKHGISDEAAQQHLYGTMLSFWQREFALPSNEKDN